MSASGGWAGGDRQTSIFSFRCSRVDDSANYTPACTKCSILLNKSQMIEFCNNWDHRLSFAELVSFVSSRSGLGENEFHLALDEDDTIVSDVEYLQCLEADTKLKMVRKERRNEVDGATVGVGELSVSGLSEIEKADRKTLHAAVEKLQRNLGSLVVLPQEELQVLYEADEDQLQLLMALSSRREVDALQTLCFDLHSGREERKERVEYLDLAKRANEWAWNTTSRRGIMVGGGMIEADGIDSSPSTAVVHPVDQADGATDQGARDSLVQDLREKADHGSQIFTLLVGLSEKQYRILLEGECEGLRALNLPLGTEGDTKRFCEEQLRLKESEQKLKGYFAQRWEQQAC